MKYGSTDLSDDAAAAGHNMPLCCCMQTMDRLWREICSWRAAHQVWWLRPSHHHICINVHWLIHVSQWELSEQDYWRITPQVTALPSKLLPFKCRKKQADKKFFECVSFALCGFFWFCHLNTLEVTLISKVFSEFTTQFYVFSNFSFYVSFVFFFQAPCCSSFKLVFPHTKLIF